MASGIVYVVVLTLGCGLPSALDPTLTHHVAPSKGRKSGTTSFEDRLLTVLPQDLHFREEVPIVCFSPDGREAACVGTTGDGEQVLVTGTTRSEKYDRIWPLIYCAEAHAFAYAAENVDGAYVVMGELKSEKFDQIGWLQSDPASPGIAYSARKGSKWFVISGGKKGEDFDEIGPERTSVGSVLIYTARKEGKWCVVCGDRKGDEFDAIDCLTSAAESEVICYAASTAGEHFIVLSGAKLSQPARAHSIVLGPKARSFAYAIQKDGRAYVVFQSSRGEDFDEVRQLTLNADGTNIAYAARKGSKWFVVAGNQKSDAFALILYPTFMPDGRTVSYVAVDVQTAKYFIVLGGKKGEELPIIIPSPSQNVASFSTNHRQLHLAICPDGTAAAYLTLNPAGKWQLIAGRSRSEPVDYISEAVFSSDGLKVGFGTLKGRDLWWKVMEVK